MNDVFRHYLNKFVVVYIDDIFVYSRSLEKHKTHQRTVLGLLRKNRLNAKASKSVFFKDKVKFLGHLVTKDGVKTDPQKC